MDVNRNPKRDTVFRELNLKTGERRALRTGLREFDFNRVTPDVSRDDRANRPRLAGYVELHNKSIEAADCRLAKYRAVSLASDVDVARWGVCHGVSEHCAEAILNCLGLDGGKCFAEQLDTTCGPDRDERDDAVRVCNGGRVERPRNVGSAARPRRNSARNAASS